MSVCKDCSFVVMILAVPQNRKKNDSVAEKKITLHFWG
jgi:hypothetical protein